MEKGLDIIPKEGYGFKSGSDNSKSIQEEFVVGKVADDVIQEMLKEKQDNPDIIIPYSFLEFYNRPEMLDLITSVHNYAKSLIIINFRYSQLRQEGKVYEATRYSEKQSLILPDLVRSIAKKYGNLILKQKGLISSLDEINFFETVIFFIVRVVKSAFTPEQGIILDNELNRLFRSTAFNIAQRKNTENERVRKFPQLKASPKRDPESVINSIIMRNYAKKSDVKALSFESVSRPAFTKISPYKAITSRSPLISLILPSPKDKIREFEEYRRRLIAKSAKLPELSSRS